MPDKKQHITQNTKKPNSDTCKSEKASSVSAQPVVTKSQIETFVRDFYNKYGEVMTRLAYE